MEPLEASKAIPYLIQAQVDGLTLDRWAETHTEAVLELLHHHRALLFRGFLPLDSKGFHRFIELTSSGDLLEYRDRTTPRKEVGDRIYTSTEYPASQEILLHNEGTYWMAWPKKIYFLCTQPALEDGATPIADCRGVLQRIPPAIRAEFAEKGWRLVRNFGKGLGLSWQEVFQTASRDEVDDYCRHAGILHQWLSDDRLRTVQSRPAIHRHHLTGEQLWFNHAAFFHISSRPAPIREALLAEFSEEDLPYQTYFGDGTSIPDEVALVLRQAYEAERTRFSWQLGDLMMLDNMTVAHARESYAGDRTILAGMAEMVTSGSSGSVGQEDL